MSSRRRAGCPAERCRKGWPQASATKGKARAAGAAAGFSAAAGAMRGHLQKPDGRHHRRCGGGDGNTLRQPARRMQSGEAR